MNHRTKSSIIRGILWVGGLLILFGLGVLMLPNYSTHYPTNSSRSLQLAIALEAAVNNFFTEYGKLPDVGTHLTTDTENGVKFLNILLGIEELTDKAQNPRKIKFLGVREGKNKKGGIIYDSSNKVQGLYDAWGNPYTVEINVSAQEPLRFMVGSRRVELKHRRPAAYSPGPDGKLGTADDVTTW